MAEPFISGKLLSTGRNSFCVSLFFLLIFFCARPSSAQDLGALARQEQARKEAQPVHSSHVYTNDDLARPKILVPEDRSQFASKQNKIKLSPMPAPEIPATQASVPEIAQPEIAAAPGANLTGANLTDASATQVSLGEIARQYQKQKLAQRLPAPAAVSSTVAAHVYSNDDLARDQILTPEDSAAYQAALEKPVEFQIETPAQPEAGEVASTETPLGDLARAVYQRAKQEFDVQMASMAQVQKTWSSLARKVSRKRSDRVPRGVLQVEHSKPQQRAKRQSPASQTSGFEVVTIRSGDSLWKLARRHLGHGVRWRALLAANPEIRDPYQLKVGITIRV
jgi:nucleoid-associated protein YgaU